MASLIKPRRGTSAPTSGTINQHELAVDTTNNRIYIGAADGSGTLIGSAPGGSDTQVQFNDSGILGGDSGLTYNKTTDTLTLAGDLAVNGGDLTTTAGTATVFNTNATTLNVGGAASSTINIGATDGTSTIDLNSNLLKEVEFRNYFETKATASTTTVGMATYLLCDLSSSNVFTFSISGGAISGISVTNIPSKANTSVGFTIVITNGAALSSFNYDVFVSGSVKWAGGTPPTYTTTIGNTDIISYVTYDGGTTWYGFVGGLDFS